MLRSIWTAALFSFLPLSFLLGLEGQDSRGRHGPRIVAEQRFGAAVLAAELKRSTTPPYQSFCSVCHGETGKGDGPLAPLLNPKPVDFTLGRPVITDRVGGLASEERLLRIIREGMPGSSMPAFHDYGDGMMRVAGLSIPRLAVTRRFQLLRQAELDAGRPVNEEQLRKQAAKELGLAKEIAVPDFTGFAADLKRGEGVYRMACAACHGVNGAGLEGMFVDAKGHSIGSRDLRRGLFRGGTSTDALFRRVRAGVPYSGMPAYSAKAISDEDLMHLVGFLQSLLRQRLDCDDQIPWPGRQKTPTFFVGYRANLPKGVEDPLWAQAPVCVPTLLHFERHDRQTGRGLELRALHDRERIAIRVTWKGVPGRKQVNGFGDGIALQLSAQPSPAFFLEARFRGKRFKNLGPAWFWSSHHGGFRASPEYVPGQLQLLHGKRWAVDADAPQIQAAKKDGRYSVMFVRRLAVAEAGGAGGEVPISGLRETRLQLQCFDAERRSGLRGMAFSLWGRLRLDP